MSTAEQLLEQFEEAQAAGEEAAAEAALERLRREHPDRWERSRAEVGWRLFVDEAEAERPPRELLERSDAHGSLLGWLEGHAARWPDDADVRHELGAALFEVERDEEAIGHWLAVLELDIGQDEELGIGNAEDERFVMEVASRILAELPPEFGERLGSVPVVVEPRPSAELVRTGFDPRAFGLFEGPTQAEADGPEPPAAPTRIVLFLANLVAEFPEDAELGEQVRITVLHEVGHYFGLDEIDMVRLGLD